MREVKNESEIYEWNSQDLGRKQVSRHIEFFLKKLNRDLMGKISIKWEIEN